jgi:UDP-glucuronate decarboxylase
VSGLIALMNSDYSQPVNLGNPEEHTIKEFAKIIQKEIGNFRGSW